MAEQTDIRALRRSPLARLTDEMEAASVSGARGVALREIPFLVMVGLRVRPDSPAAQRVAEVAGAPLPETVGQVTGDPTGQGVALLWQGPDESLVVAPDEVEVPAGLQQERDPADGALPSMSTGPLAVALAEAFVEAGAPGQAVDLSANRTTIELTGPSARAVLDKGCALDLHPREFPVGRAVSTVLAHVPVILWRTGEDEWRVMPRASFAEHVARWLMDAMREFAAPELA